MSNPTIPIYLVIGSTSEGADRSCWIVRAFESREAADDLRELAAYKADRHFAIAKGLENKPDLLHNLKVFLTYAVGAKSSVDPNFKMDYIGTIYFVLTKTLQKEAQNAT